MALIKDILRSLKGFPLRVVLWAFLCMAPVNFATLLFLWEPGGVGLAVLATMGIIPNFILMATQRGFSNAFALPHLIFWPPAILWSLWLLVTAEGLSTAYTILLVLLIIIDGIAVWLDWGLWRDWRNGDRGVIGHDDD